MSRKMVLVPETFLTELKGKLPKSPNFKPQWAWGSNWNSFQTETISLLKKEGLGTGINFTGIAII